MMNELSQHVQRYVLLPLICAVVLIVARDSVASMVRLWSLSSYQHAWLVPLISLYLLWTGPRFRTDAPLSVSPLGFILLCLAVWVWVVARLTLVQAAEHLALWAMLNTATIFVLGWQSYRAVMIPMLFLVFALPVGTSMVPALMEATADISLALLTGLGVPVLREGVFFTLPGGSFVVADLCAGHRYLNAGLCISALFAVLMFSKWLKGAVFVLASGAFFVLINGLRAATVMAIGSASQMRYLANDHILFGWSLFLLGTVLIYWIGLRYADDPASGSR